ncbi:MAG: hypothetical protein CL908_02375 [Deltaproteobacteria bacterium]|nr:hypothetical protein [Deltaproteobacteria bacterium]
MSSLITRRHLLRSSLRGTLAGATIAVGLPYLDIFLDGHGEAIAATGAPLPRRFGTWFFGCGMNPARWNPTQEGRDFDLPPELAPIETVREYVSVLSGFSVILDGETNHVHRTGVIGTLCGGAPPTTTENNGATLDILISDMTGGATRFKSLEMAATGVAKDTYSRRSEDAKNPSETTPLSLYTRIFGPGFSDPNAGEFVPDPKMMLRKSVLSVVFEDRKRIESMLGARDRARLDEYFTSLRQLERQLELQLSAPPPLEACRVEGEPAEGPVSREVGHVKANHEAMAKVLALALACDQTRVFNMVFSEGASQLHMPGSADTHHTLTHEEARDKELGYQVEATKFVMHSMDAWKTFVETLAAVPEGAGTLLDSCAVLAHSETSDANSHSVTGLPMMIAGGGGGRLSPGVHVRGTGDPTTRVGLTLQQVMGLNVAKWGFKANETSRPVAEILA